MQSSKNAFCKGITDYMIIWRGQPDSSDHEKHLTEFLHVTRKCNLKLKVSKPQYRTKHASFIETTFTSHGHKPENENV